VRLAAAARPNPGLVGGQAPGQALCREWRRPAAASS